MELVATNSIRGGANRRALQAATVKRRIFEAWSDEPWVIDGAAVLNPFQSVRGVRNPFGDGKTPEVTVGQARQLLASVKTDSVYGLRDRAVLGTLIYTGARVGAISGLRMQDLRDNGNHRSLQFCGERGQGAGDPGAPYALFTWSTSSAVGGGQCIKSLIGEFSRFRSDFAFANPGKQTKVTESSGSRSAFFSFPRGPELADHKTGCDGLEKSPPARAALAGSGRRPGTYP